MIHRTPSGTAVASLLTLHLLTALLAGTAQAAGTPAPAPASSHDLAAWPDSIWPEGSDLWHFENLEGVILIPAILRSTSGRDTSGPMVLDTGAGYLAVDRPLAHWLGVTDQATADDTTESVGLAPHRLPRASIGRRQMDQISPVLTIDASVIRNVTDRPVLGLLGQAQFANAALAIDYRARKVAMIVLPASPGGAPNPAAATRKALKARRAHSFDQLSAVIPRDAIAVPFELAGDGKVLVTARIANSDGSGQSQELTLIVDTGATKSVFFEESLEIKSKAYRSWPAMRGITAPTLFGTAEAFVTRAPRFDLDALEGRVRRTGLDAGVINSELRPLLSRLVGRPVDGLLGYSFLKHYRLVLDYPNQILWLSPQPAGWDDRPYEYSQVGVQIERRSGEAMIVAVVRDSPAEQAGLRSGDTLVGLDGVPAASLDIVTLSERLEGPPGSAIQLGVRRGGAERTYRLERRWLLAP